MTYQSIQGASDMMEDAPSDHICTMQLIINLLRCNACSHSCEISVVSSLFKKKEEIKQIKGKMPVFHVPLS